jgi:L-lactate dehydrogenase (cytochrome)
MGNRLERASTVEDVRRIARRRLPRMIMDFVDGGAEDELTMARNRHAFAALALEPRYLVDVERRDTAATVMGTDLATPLLVAPTGLMGLAHPDGELAVARGAAAVGAGYIVTTSSSRTLEAIAAAADGPRWLQVYLWKDRGVTREIVERARAAGYRALLLTVDVPVFGQRERDLRNGMKVPLRLSVGNALNAARHPGWLRGLARGGVPTFANMAGVPGAQGDRGTSLIEYVNRELFDASQSWADFEWLREIWDRPLGIKGVLGVDDARRAAQCGADGILVSNHGGRQLDGAPASLEALSRIRDVVGGAVDLLLDGGVRRGSDAVKALALGASAVVVGRPTWYGLGAGGADGVRRVLDILSAEVARTMALIGATSIGQLDDSYVRADQQVAS